MKSTAGVGETARAVLGGETTAHAVVIAALGRIEANNGRINGFSDITSSRATLRAADVDERVERGEKLALAGVPFAIANNFRLQGFTTRAGSKIGRADYAAGSSAALVDRLEAAGAICVGALNMSEYGYDFTGENAHDGPVHNPHDAIHMAGGASCGAAAVVAAGMVPLTLGIDTTGGVRIPAAMSGAFALKPTFGRLSRRGMFALAASFDGPGIIGRSVEDVALGYDALQGYDPEDPAMVKRPLEAVAGRLERGSAGLRIGIADGPLRGDGEARQAVEAAMQALGQTRPVALDDVAAARAAAALIVMTEASTLHLERLRQRPQDFDPQVRDKLLTGALLPASWIGQAQRFRRVFHDRMLELFGEIDALIAPAVPVRAPRLGQKTMALGGVDVPLRPNLGAFTEPFSLSGFPVVTVPIASEGKRLPLGLQVMAAPWREDFALRVARQLEKAGLARAPVARGFADAPDA
jgi:aspartyl-tRNA(Asn)/glutamyl-tRNA(Gln) amidotransferase subunit A